MKNNDMLETIKDDVAKENDYKSWESIYLISVTDRLWPVVCERYATECIKELQEENSRLLDMKEDEKMKLINADEKWHSWKCRCGCLNRRSNGNCGRCGGYPESYSHFYGSDGYVNPIGRP